MLLSAVVQMKNSLVKCLEHEAKQKSPDLTTWTQPPTIVNDQEFDDRDLIIYTPEDCKEEEPLRASVTRENVNLLYLYDDSVYLDFLMRTLRAKGVKIVDFPALYDLATVVPFLLVNDHSIVVVRNPKKDVLPLLKQVMRRGTIYFKQQNQPIQVNITLWILVDVLPYVDKGAKGADKKPPKRLQEMILRDYGTDFHSFFDLVVDMSQYSNVEVLGTDYLKFQENLMLDRFACHLDQDLLAPGLERSFVFEYKELKCLCKKQNLIKAGASLPSIIAQKNLSLGELFIQHYYLTQRKLHSQNEVASSFYHEERIPTSEVNWITLADVVKIKKLADNINFMRLFFLKSSDEQVNQLKVERSLTDQASRAFFNLNGLEIVDCVLAIFIFELYRLFRSGRSLVSKDQFQFKILYFFSRLKLSKRIDTDG